MNFEGFFCVLPFAAARHGGFCDTWQRDLEQIKDIIIFTNGAGMILVGRQDSDVVYTHYEGP